MSTFQRFGAEQPPEDAGRILLLVLLVVDVHQVQHDFLIDEMELVNNETNKQTNKQTKKTRWQRPERDAVAIYSFDGGVLFDVLAVLPLVEDDFHLTQVGLAHFVVLDHLFQLLGAVPAALLWRTARSAAGTGRSVDCSGFLCFLLFLFFL